MRLRTQLVAHQLLIVGALASACGDAGDAKAGTDEAGTPATSDSPSASCDRECRAAQRRADRMAKAAARCQALLPDVHLTYRITAAPVTGGNEIGLRMTLANRSDAFVQGSTAGTLKVDAGGARSRISWGGSSADELYQNPGTAESRPVWHDRMPPGWYPVGTRVTSFDFSTYTYAPGRGEVLCWLPARVVAPPGLVSGHPSGRWTQQSSHRF